VRKVACSICFLFSVFVYSSEPLVYVDFDLSVQTERYQDIIFGGATFEKVGLPGDELLNFFKKLYERNNFITLNPSNHPKIPKIIHQIWIGDNVPEKFKPFQRSWLENHPDWKYRLWTQDDIKQFGFKNIDLIDASNNPGEISDIMRYEILYRYGGVYIDFDFECLQSLDELNYLYDFYIGIQPLDCGFVQLGIGLIGSVPGHPILEHAIQKMKENWNLPENIKNPPKRTGPIYFTRSFFACAGQGDFVDVALPVHYFYPLGCTEYDLQYDLWLHCGSFGVHHWASSWLKPQFRRKRFQDL